MKNKLALASLAAALAAFAGFASTTKADGGIRIGIGFGDYGRPIYHEPVYGQPHYAVPERPVHVRPGYGYQGYYSPADRGPIGYAPGYGSNYCPPTAPVVIERRPSGYWENVRVKTWVPGRRVETVDQWGRPACFMEPGYFAYRIDRVWVNCRD